jgi:hypothetical protein
VGAVRRVPADAGSRRFSDITIAERQEVGCGEDPGPCVLMVVRGLLRRRRRR